MYKKIKYLPSPIPFFLFGFSYYIISPIASIYLSTENRFVDVALQHVEKSDYGIEYMTISLISLLSFICSYLISTKLKFGKLNIGKRLNTYVLAPFTLFFALFLILSVAIFKGLTSGVVFFSGYSDYNISVLGPMATVLFCSVIFKNYFHSSLINFLFFSLFLVTSLFMLGLGSRMFFVLGVITMLINKVCYSPGIMKKPLFISTIVLLFILVLMIGVMRGNDEVSIIELLNILLAEPLFTSVSNAKYFSSIDSYIIINAPLDLIASTINFMPSFVFADKVELMNEIGYDLKRFSPFGASGILVNVYKNFGVLFFLYFSFMGFFFGSLRKLAMYNHLFYCIYISSLPLLMFHFFREGFVTFIKVQFFNALILPIICVLILDLFFRVIKNKKV